MRIQSKRQTKFARMNCRSRPVVVIVLLQWLLVGSAADAALLQRVQFAADAQPSQTFNADPGQNQNFFSKAGAAIRQSTSNAGNRIKSLFKPAESQAEPTVPSPWTNSRKAKSPDPDLYVAFARVQEQNGSFEDAERNLEQALKKDPKHLEALLAMARLHERMGKPQKALEYYQQAVRYHPHEAAAHNDLALCYARLGKLPESVGSLQRAIAIEPQRKLYRNNIARSLVAMGRPDEAYSHLIAVYEPAIVYYNLGYLLNERGDYRAALEHFERALEINPGFTQARQWQMQLASRVHPYALAQRPMPRPPAYPPPAPSSPRPMNDAPSPPEPRNSAEPPRFGPRPRPSPYNEANVYSPNPRSASDAYPPPDAAAEASRGVAAVAQGASSLFDDAREAAPPLVPQATVPTVGSENTTPTSLEHYKLSQTTEARREQPPATALPSSHAEPTPYEARLDQRSFGETHESLPVVPRESRFALEREAAQPREPSGEDRLVVPSGTSKPAFSIVPRSDKEASAESASTADQNHTSASAAEDSPAEWRNDDLSPAKASLARQPSYRAPSRY
jgi:tetratricopeptide (TPR) repeat protein